MNSFLSFIRSNRSFWAIMCLSIGLAPFVPEPHIWGKLKWISGGAVGMTGLDWFDVLLHGTPWILLIISLIIPKSNNQLPSN